MVSRVSMREMVGESSVIVKPRNDDRDYKRVLLSNGLQVLLVSDPDTDKVTNSLARSLASLCTSISRISIPAVRVPERRNCACTALIITNLYIFIVAGWLNCIAGSCSNGRSRGIVQ